ncbi:hypothetical protein EOM39_06490 [Candidatus Gracilibacteria bacterium]|nr:hypothetical protein [Candidatus Gracilibacteria bacterium]
MHNFIESGICMGGERIKDKNGKTLHPTQKPISILKHLIEISSDEGDIVLDPFMGVGSTGEACKQLNRQFIGIELDKTYYEASKIRLGVKDDVNIEKFIIEKIEYIRNITVKSLCDLRFDLVKIN